MLIKGNISDRLKELRGNLTQAQAANKVGLAQQGWARYESGKVMPGAEAIQQICTSFGCASDWLLGLKDHDGGATGKNPASESTSSLVAGKADICQDCKYKRLADAFKSL